MKCDNEEVDMKEQEAKQIISGSFLNREILLKPEGSNEDFRIYRLHELAVDKAYITPAGNKIERFSLDTAIVNDARFIELSEQQPRTTTETWLDSIAANPPKSNSDIFSTDTEFQLSSNNAVVTKSKTLEDDQHTQQDVGENQRAPFSLEASLLSELENIALENADSPLVPDTLADTVVVDNWLTHTDSDISRVDDTLLNLSTEMIPNTADRRNSPSPELTIEISNDPSDDTDTLKHTVETLNPKRSDHPVRTVARTRSQTLLSRTNSIEKMDTSSQSSDRRRLSMNRKLSVHSPRKSDLKSGEVTSRANGSVSAIKRAAVVSKVAQYINKPSAPAAATTGEAENGSADNNTASKNKMRRYSGIDTVLSNTKRTRSGSLGVTTSTTKKEAVRALSLRSSIPLSRSTSTDQLLEKEPKVSPKRPSSTASTPRSTKTTNTVSNSKRFGTDTKRGMVRRQSQATITINGKDGEKATVSQALSPIKVAHKASPQRTVSVSAPVSPLSQLDTSPFSTPRHLKNSRVESLTFSTPSSASPTSRQRKSTLKQNPRSSSQTQLQNLSSDDDDIILEIEQEPLENDSCVWTPVISPNNKFDSNDFEANELHRSINNSSSISPQSRASPLSISTPSSMMSGYTPQLFSPSKQIVCRTSPDSPMTSPGGSSMRSPSGSRSPHSPVLPFAVLSSPPTPRKTPTKVAKLPANAESKPVGTVRNAKKTNGPTSSEADIDTANPQSNEKDDYQRNELLLSAWRRKLQPADGETATGEPESNDDEKHVVDCIPILLTEQSGLTTPNEASSVGNELQALQQTPALDLDETTTALENDCIYTGIVHTTAEGTLNGTEQTVVHNVSIENACPPTSEFEPTSAITPVTAKAGKSRHKKTCTCTLQ